MKEEKKRDFQYVYFIENHIINANVTISLENNSNEVNSLEEIPQPNYKSDKGVEFKCSLYRFKLKIKQKNFNVTINLKDDKDENFQKTITIPDTNRDNYIYDFIFETKKTSEPKEPPTSFIFSHEQQLEMYVNYLRKQNIKQQDDENKNLILSTLTLLMGKGKKYKFSFYLMIFLECFATPLIQSHLATFKAEKIEEIGEIPTARLKSTKGIIGVFERKPEKVLDNIKDIKNREINGIRLFTVIIYFYYNFSRDKLLNLFLTKDENIQNYIIKSLIERKNDLFINFKFSKEEIHNLMNCIKSIEQLNVILKYNVTNLLELISIISDEFNAFCDIFSSEANKKKAEMNIDEIIEFSENDNFKEIYEKYIELIKREKESNKNLFFLFQIPLLKKYIKFYEDKSVENLIYIKNIVKFMKDNVDNKFEIKELNEIIHNTGLKLSKDHSFKNNDILEFIKKDEYYNSKEYNKKIYRSLDILNGLDINSFDDQFYSNWKTIDWQYTFDEQYYEFIKKVSDLIKDMKDFDILFKLFDKSKNENQQDYHQYSLNIMQSKFCELQKNYDPQKCPNFKDNLILLLFFSDQKRENIEIFLKENLQKNFNVNLVNEIYIKLLSTYKDVISSNTKSIITNFFSKNESNKNPETLLYLIKNCPELSKDMLQNIDEYIIKREELLEPQENEKMKLFIGLLNEKILEKPEFQETYYVEKVVSAISKVQNEITNGEILYRDISKFYSDEGNDEENTKEKQKDLLFQRLCYISLNKKEDAKKLLDIIEKYYSRINIILNDSKIVLEDFLIFFKNKQKENIKSLKIFIDEIKNGSLNYYEKNKNKNENVEKLIKDNKNDAIDRNFISQSDFFMTIFENNKKLIKDDNICLKETLKNFNELSILFEENGIQKLNQFNLKNCLRTIKGKEKKELSNSINILKNIFEKTKNIKVINEEEVINDLIILSRKDDVENVTNSIITFIEKLELEKETLWKECKKIISTLQASNKKEDIEKSISTLNNFEIKIDMLYNNENLNEKKYLDILLKLNEQPQSITFLLERNREDCRNLQELAGEMDNGFLNANDILDLEKCVLFMKELGDKETFKNKIDIDVIKSFKEKVKKHKDIELLFTNYINNYPEIKNLFVSGYDKSETSKMKIGLICRKSKFILKNIKGKFFEGEYYNEKDECIKIKKEKLLEFRDRAQLTKKVKNDDEELKNLENYKKFVERVSEINNIHDVLKEIYMAGYPKEIEVQINLEKYKSNFLIIGLEKENEEKEEEEEGGEKKEEEEKRENKEEEEKREKKKYQKALMKLISTLNNLRKAQIIAYKTYPLIRFIYGRQFNLIYNILKEKKINIDKLSPFLMLLKNNIMKNDISNFSYKWHENVYEDMIENIERFLNEILKQKDEKFNIENIYKETLVKKKDKGNKYKGLYLYLCDKLEKDLFQIYKYLTENNPVAQTVLLCNKETTNEELTCFLYRAILCEYNSCFIIGGIELLEFDKKSKLLELLNRLYADNNENITSCLIILYTTRTSEIYKSLDSLKYRNILDIKKEDFENLKIISNVDIITSDFSGVGKSTQIKLSVEKEKKKYIYFPLGGVFKREDIVIRLKNLKISTDSVLHLDLYDTDQTDLMMEFLFSILITKLYGQNEDIFYFLTEIDIKIEIPNGFIDFLQKFPILTLFHITKLSINSLAPLIVENDVNSNVQIVANYLKALKNNIINEKDLYFEKISPDNFSEYKTKLDAVVLSQKECQELIFDEIKNTIKVPNYYQIKSFIDILAEQFSKFGRNFIFEANTLIYTKSKIREFAIKSFIKITKHFTEGAFTKIVKSQKKTHDYLFGQYDENKDNDKGMEDLANADHEVVSFDKIDPSLIFFHEGESQLFSIITNKPSNDPEYKNLLKFRNCQALKQSDIVQKLPDYQSFKAIDFLKELKEILGLTNLVTDAGVKKEKETKKIEEEKEKEEKEKEEKEKEEKEEEEEEEKEDKEEDEEEEKGDNKEVIKKKGDENKKNRFKKKTLEEIAKNYVFTADNFVKMALILLRIRANIPVIMMGETGCGKTSLIRKLSELINNGSTKKMKILNIHAGINDKDIINFLEKKVIKQAQKLQEKENEKKQKLVKGQFYSEKKLWVFLDEINTCKSMGLISEIMCKHTYQGNPLPSNIVFIAACNPYRHGKKNIMKNAGLNVKDAHQEKKHLNQKEIERMNKSANSNLVYTVNPLPHSLLNFVFDFGKLKDEDEERYIESIILEPIKKTFSKNENDNLEKEDDEIEKNPEFKSIHQLAKDMIVTAQNFIRSNNDISSVSLREIRRFNIFYEFFFKYLKKKKATYHESQNEEEDKNFFEKLTSNDLQFYSITLAVFNCYYLRIPDHKTRKNLEKEITKLIEKYNSSHKKNYKGFLELPEKEETYIIENIELEKGIAKNKALKDNIFSLFVAINTKVPIFIVGKPGCSKSLSVQLINKAMKGEESKKPLFKGLPKIILNSFQGSMGSTSEGVENIFKKARRALKRLKKVDKKNNISMIFFDEMGLAEHSPNNPLKVIHSELEYDLNEGDKKIAFVGISNWALDASKMNRGMYLSIPEPSKKDVQETSLTIGQSYDAELAKDYTIFYENLGLIYYNYKKYLKDFHNQDGKEDFHGNRDFYHLIKNASRSMVNLGERDIDQNLLNRIGINSIERNFGGLQFKNSDNATSLEIIKKDFNKMYPNSVYRGYYDVLDRISENILDINSRYLLVTSKSSVSFFLLSSIVSKLNKDSSFYIGSQFKKDLQSEEYTLKILNKIQLHMEHGKVLILNNLESVYPALYDLFNQNFTKVSEKNYARIAVGSSTNAFSFVHKEFRCIVSVDEDQIDEEEPPFLNRFEKHILSFEYLIKKEKKLIDISKSICMNVKKMISCSEKDFKGMNYNFEKMLPNLDSEEILGIIYDCDQKGVNFQDLEEEVFKKISLILPQDIMLIQRFNGFQSNNPDLTEAMMKEYKKGEHGNLRKFLEKMDNMKNIVYTYSNVLDVIEDLDSFDNKNLSDKEIKKDTNIMELEISSFDSENDFEKNIDLFLNNEDYKLCIIKFKAEEGKFLNYIRFFIKNKENEYLIEKKNEENKKAFVFIVYLKRIYNSEIDELENKAPKQQEIINKKILKETISLLSEYYQIFIDNLNGDGRLSLEDLLNSNSLQLYEKCLDLDFELRENIYTTLSYIKYKIFSSLGELNKETYVNNLTYLIQNDNELRNEINKCLKKQMSTEENIIFKILQTENSITSDDIDMINVIRRHLSNSYAKLLNNFYYKLEKEQYFSSLLSVKELINIEKKKSLNIIEKGEIHFLETEPIKKILIKTRKIYLEEFNFNDSHIKENVVENPGNNELEIIFGFKLPGMKSIIESIINQFKKDIFSKYKSNENSLRSNIDEEDINNKINLYKENLTSYNKPIMIELKKNNLLSRIIDKENSKQFFDLFLEDYYILFVDKYLNKIRSNEKDEKDKNNIDFESAKKMLKLMVKLRNDSNDIFKEYDQLEKTISTIIWIEFYSINISIILQMFLKLNSFIENLFEEVNEIINNKKIKYEISKRCKEYTSIVNETLFFGMESILKVITSNEKVYINLIKNFEEFKAFINVNKEILQLALKLEANLDLYSKEAFSLQELLKITDFLIPNKIVTPENISKIINLFSVETDLLNEDKENENKLTESFGNLYNTLETLIGKDESFNEIMSTVFKNEFIKVTNESFRIKLLEIVMSKNEFIYTNNQLFKFIISIDISPENILENLDRILLNQNSLYKFIDQNCNKEFLEHVIMNIFEYKILSFFESIPKLDYKDENIRQKFELYFQSIEDKKENETLIIHNLSFDLFKQCASFLDEFLNNEVEKDDIKNYNLCKLYAISYIKIYLNKLSTFIYEKNQFVRNTEEIMTIIKGTNQNDKMRNVLKIYIFKIFYNLMDKSWENLLSFNYENNGIDFANILINEESSIIKEIICEEKSPTEEKYKDYPLLKYFTYTKYRTKNDFMKLLEPKEKCKEEYPLLFKYLFDSDVKKLTYLSYINEFSNYLIQYYSFKISREEAKTKTLNEEQELIDQFGERKIKNFLVSWKKIKSKAVQFKFHKLKEGKEFSKKTELVYFLNDINEEGYGMYLASAYQNFINWQNEFLDFIIKNGCEKENLKFYIDNMNKKINIQDANLNQTLLINGCFNGSYYEDFVDLIYTFSRRDIFKKDGTINYSNYNSFKYEIKIIEDELAKLLLPGKCLFEDENNLKFVSYWGEGFNGGKSDVLQQFFKKYKQTDLNENEKKILIDYFVKNNNGNHNKQVYGTIQIIIFYLLNNNLDEKEKIFEINFPNYLRIEPSFIEFLTDKGQDFTADKIMGIYFLFEHLCFNDLCKTIQNEYKEEISNEINEKIENNFLNNNNVNNIIPIKDLAAAVRRFISRYLVGNKTEDNIIPNSLLLPQLKRPDLWDEKFGKLPNLDELISKVLQDLNLTVGQSFKFYEKIKTEDEKEILFGEEDNDDENINFQRRKNPKQGRRRN